MPKLLTILLFLIVLTHCADKEEWRKRSIYQLLTDRFARNDGQQYGCDNLGNSILTQETTVAEDTGASSTT